MSRILLYFPELSRDFVAAIDYYEALSPGLGLRFEEAFAQAELEIEEGLVTHPVLFDHFHRVVLRRFPYRLYYRLQGDAAIVVGLFHIRRDPTHVQRTLDERIPGN